MCVCVRTCVLLSLTSSMVFSFSVSFGSSVENTASSKPLELYKPPRIKLPFPSPGLAPVPSTSCCQTAPPCPAVQTTKKGISQPSALSFSLGHSCPHWTNETGEGVKAYRVRGWGRMQKYRRHKSIISSVGWGAHGLPFTSTAFIVSIVHLLLN